MTLNQVLEYPVDPSLIHEQYSSQVEIVIDGGPGGIEGSTVIDCSKGAFEVIREGKGSIEDF